MKIGSDIGSRIFVKIVKKFVLLMCVVFMSLVGMFM